MQVVTSPCCPRQLPDVISNSLFLDAGSPTPAVHRVLSPVSSTMSSAFPREKVGRLPAAIPLETTSCGGTFEVADISLCSGLQVCSPPRSSLPLRILPQGSRGFYVRAERGSLPPRASDMLTARRQAIGGTGTCTPLAWIMHDVEKSCGDSGGKQPIHVATRCSNELPCVSTLRHSDHERRYAAAV